MIISASRRTDIPNYYTDWFFRRLGDGFVLVRNPMNPRQISRIPLSPDVIDCIVFWTKNPSPMSARLGELTGYSYCFLFTLTPYGADIEPNVPIKSEVVDAFRRLSDRIGPERVVWRYDPILINPRYNTDDHMNDFEIMAESLEGYTNTCIISFIDEYRNTRSNAAKLGLMPLSGQDMPDMAARLSAIARSRGIALQACAEKIDLTGTGVRRAGCIDKSFIERITGCRIEAGKDKNQRAECGCIESIDIGAYNTCPNRCLYCYANYNAATVQGRYKTHDPKSPMLYSAPGPGDVITERNIQSFKKTQIMFDMD